MTPHDLIEFLLSPANYPHQVGEIEHVETHISHIFLTGQYAYKLKKEVKLSFLDFSTLKLRQHFCERELHLNQRFAPEIYLEVVPLYKSHNTYSFTSGEVTDFLVKMKQFPTDSLFSELAARNDLSCEMIEKTIESIYTFHTRAQKAPSYWDASQLTNFIDECFEIIEAKEPPYSPYLSPCKEKIYSQLSRYERLLKLRQKTHVKLLHGDLHLKNICLYNNTPTPFDGIEFGDQYAASDGWGDISFLIMDLLYENQPNLATRATNHYLELSDDYEGLELLPLYISYRALVRAKIASLRDNQDSCNTHIELAHTELSLPEPNIIALGGPSGSGKSTIAKAIATLCRCIILRSDAIRKHLGGVPLLQRGGSSLYTPEMSQRTYNEMLKRAEHALTAGYSVIFDATHLEHEYREQAEDFAKDHNASFHGFWLEAPKETLERRVSERKSDVSDATPDVLEQQLEKEQPECTWYSIDSEQSPKAIAEFIMRKVKNSIE